MAGTPTSAADYAAIAAQSGKNASTPYNPNAATSGSQIPTKAPSAGSPTAVNSSTPASNLINNQIVPAMNQAQTDLSNHNLKLTQGQPFQGGTVNYDANTGQKLQPGQTTQANTPTAPTPPTNDTTTAPPSDGHYATWDSQGNRSDVPVGTQPAPGYSTTKPNNPVVNGATPVNSYENSDGTKVAQFSDGTYGSLDQNGNFTGSLSASGYSSAIQGTATYQQEQYVKTMQGLQTQMLSITTGSFPLNAVQQAQVNGITSQLAQDIQTQTTANANYTGGVTVAQNLYGLGNTTIGLGAIQQSITEGVTAIANLQSKAASTVASMTDAFQKENYSELKDQYDEYNEAQKGIQDNLDKINSAITAKQEADRQYNLQVEQAHYTQVQKPIDDAVSELTKNGAPKSVIDAAEASGSVAGALEAGAGYFQDPTSIGGMYEAYTRNQVDAGKPIMTPADFVSAQKYSDALAAARASSAYTYQNAYNAAAGKDAADAKFAGSSTNQDKLEAQFATTLKSQLSNRSGGLGLQDQKVNQAIHLKSLVNQYKTTDKKGNTVYNIPSSQYSELALGLANLVSGGTGATESQVNNIQQATLKGDFNKAISFATGAPQNGSTQDIIKNLIDSIDRQGEVAENLRDQDVELLKGLAPTDLDPSRVESLTEHTLSSFTDPSKNIANVQESALSQIQSFHDSDPKNAAMIDEIHKQYPDMSATEVAQKLGLTN